ncbi:putative inner membrane protein [Chlamydia psittaci VS225]|nr:putative inner membrane protein [Chlamydia psittaci VS225]
MNCREVCKESLQIYFDSTFPERVVARRCQNKAQQYPKTAMAIEVLASVVFGTIKIITFPLLTFSNLISLPLTFMVSSLRSRDCSQALSYFNAWVMSLLISAMIIGAIFGLVMISPQVVFFMIGVFGALGASATLLNIHRGLFPVKSLQTQEIKRTASLEESLSSPSIAELSPTLNRQNSSEVANLDT